MEVKNKLPLTGINIYYNNKNQIIYYHPLFKKGYVVKPELEEKFKIFKSRFLVPILLFILSKFSFGHHYLLAILFAVIGFAYIEYHFIKTLNSLTTIAVFDKKYYHQSFKVNKEFSQKPIVVKIILLPIISCLLIVNIFLEKQILENQFLFALTIMVIIVSIFYFFHSCYMLYKIKKAN